MSEHISINAEVERSEINENATFASINPSFAKDLGGLEKNTSSFFQESGKPSSPLTKISAQRDNLNGARDFRSVEDSKLTFNVSRLLNNDSLFDTDTATLNARTVSETGEMRGSKNKRTNARWSVGAPSARNTQMTLKEQERVIDEIKKENFSLKMKVYFLEEQLSKSGPDEMERALKENIEMRVQIHDFKAENSKIKKQLQESKTAFEKYVKNSTQCQLPHGMSPQEEEEYNQAIAKAEELEQQNNAIQRRYAENVSELKRLRELVHLSKSENDNSGTVKHETQGEKRKPEMNNQDFQVPGSRDLARERQLINENENENRAQELVKKARQEEAEKYGVLIQQLKGQNSSLKAELTSRVSDIEEVYSELEMIRGRPKSATIPLGDISSRLINGDFSEQYEESLGHLRDKVAELTLQLREKSMEVEHLIIELDEINISHKNTIRDLEDELDRVERHLREENSDLREELDLTQNENMQLFQEFDLIQNNRQETEIRLQESMNEMNFRLQEKTQEVEDLRRALEKAEADISEYSKENQDLLDTIDQMKSHIKEEIKDLQDRLKANERKAESDDRLHEEVVASLNEKLSVNYATIKDLNASQESTLNEMGHMRQELEYFVGQVADLEKKCDSAVSREQSILAERNKERENFAREIEISRKERKESEQQFEKTLNDLNEKLFSARKQISDLELTIQERESDLNFARQQFNNQTSRNKDSAERYNKEQERLRSELDSLREESEQLNSQLEAMADELESKKTIILEYENDIKHSNNQKSKINEKLISSELARSKAEESCRNVQMDIRDKNSLIDELKSQVFHLESNLTQEKKVTYSNENQYRDQITERNTLLITTFQYLDNIMSDGSITQSNYPKPSANFSLFHENLLSKLKTLRHVHTTFECRAKEIDTRWQEQYEALRNQFEIKLRQINKFDAIVQKANLSSKDWREQTKKTQGELEVTRNANEDLIEQLSTVRDQLDDLRSANIRAEETEIKLRDAERRARNLEASLRDEERRWESRFKELEDRLKIEKQSLRVKVESVRETNQDLEGQIQSLSRRNTQLQELLDFHKAQMEVTNDTKAFTVKAENTLSFFNEQLREQLEEKNITLNNERQRLKTLEEQCARFAEQIERRDTNIMKVLENLEAMSQSKDLMENAIFRQISEEMQSTLMHYGEGNRRSTYQPPPYINPPWKPAGNTNGTSKKTIAKIPPAKTAIPSFSSIPKTKKQTSSQESGSNTKFAPPTRLPSLTSINTTNTGSSTGNGQRGFIPKLSKDLK